VVHEPTDDELTKLESAASGNPDALAAFDEYIAALSILEEAANEAGTPNLRDFEAAVAMARCELDFQLGRFI
jgi:hypothetical protein